MTSFGGDSDVMNCRWSPNGQDIYFNSNFDGKLTASVIKAEGGQAKHLTEDVDGWSRDGKWIYFGSKRSGENQLWKRPVDGGSAVQVTKKGYGGFDVGGDAVEATDGKTAYYLKGGGVWRVPVQGGEETRVLESVFTNNFAVVDQGIYFIPSSERPSIQFLSFATGRWLLYAQYESVRGHPRCIQSS